MLAAAALLALLVAVEAGKQCATEKFGNLFLPYVYELETIGPITLKHGEKVYNFNLGSDKCVDRVDMVGFVHQVGLEVEACEDDSLFAPTIKLTNQYSGRVKRHLGRAGAAHVRIRVYCGPVLLSANKADETKTGRPKYRY